MRSFLTGLVVGILATVVLAGVAVFAMIRPLMAEPAGESITTPTAPPVQGAPATIGSDASYLDVFSFSADAFLGPDADLRDVTATGEGITIEGDKATARELNVSGVVPFELVAARVGEDLQLKHAGGGEVAVSRETNVLGVTLPLRAQGAVTVAGGDIVVTPTSIDVGGPGFMQRAAGSLVRQLVTIREPVEGLPPGLALESVEVTDDGFAATLRGTDVALTFP